MQVLDGIRQDGSDRILLCDQTDKSYAHKVMIDDGYRLLHEADISQDLLSLRYDEQYWMYYARLSRDERLYFGVVLIVMPLYFIYFYANQ